jgi:hypothetical protein
MPSRKNRHFAFIPVLIFVLIMWFVYRSLFNFPIIFDEVIGKAVFFGLPVWLYVLLSGSHEICDIFSPKKTKRGLYLGLAVGGVMGFLTVLISLLNKGVGIQPMHIFSASYFWWEFTLALITSFWETLFFFGFVMTSILALLRKKTLLFKVLLTALIFLVFHLPNILLRSTGIDIFYQAILLFLFAIGQGFLFATEKNGYALVLTQVFWGMVLLVHV